MSQKAAPQRKRRQFLAAVVLGTALATMGSAETASATEANTRSVNDVSRYCSACWRNARLPLDRWGDCTQEVFSRLLQRVPLNTWCKLWSLEAPERREFLRAIDAVKKRAQREKKRNPLNDNELPDFSHVTTLVRSEERAVVNRAATELLSTRQQRILHLTCEGWTIPEMAEELNVSVQRVSDEKYKAVQKLRNYFNANAEDRA